MVKDILKGTEKIYGVADGEGGCGVGEIVSGDISKIDFEESTIDGESVFYFFTIENDEVVEFTEEKFNNLKGIK